MLESRFTMCLDLMTGLGTGRSRMGRVQAVVESPFWIWVNEAKSRLFRGVPCKSDCQPVDCGSSPVPSFILLCVCVCVCE
ncbi:unnamed protein product [Protopolystoma xenopodis]|uniref:Uncharacterized protein n=1 Tax=Protopolystoma xenopodis TaxID=117903 RepID=A0A3S5C319_9PLAT|nr:unnamed protein product [Protopolystoma xenopodis]